jgi:hypothetical protein
MSYSDLRDFNPELIAYFDDGRGDWIEVSVEKLGGGRVGEYYEGSWRYVVSYAHGSREIARGQDFHSAVTITHQRAAEYIFEIISNREK